MIPRINKDGQYHPLSRFTEPEDEEMKLFQDEEIGTCEGPKRLAVESSRGISRLRSPPHSKVLIVMFMCTANLASQSPHSTPRRRGRHLYPAQPHVSLAREAKLAITNVS